MSTLLCCALDLLQTCLAHSGFIAMTRTSPHKLHSSAAAGAASPTSRAAPWAWLTLALDWLRHGEWDCMHCRSSITSSSHSSISDLDKLLVDVYIGSISEVSRKLVSFKNTVTVILIPAKEELDSGRIWWSERELAGIRMAWASQLATQVQSHPDHADVCVRQSLQLFGTLARSRRPLRVDLLAPQVLRTPGLVFSDCPSGRMPGAVAIDLGAPFHTLPEPETLLTTSWAAHPRTLVPPRY
eukprot:TRINITY_DN13136_c0_g1_i1.p1 TRINITY_DN13136_c0_g1~~TRINITY_DN13136_c0_g1_i1.p1  ORF type:complete len:241 (+),score=8.81 TRINITY_DN13136_c0_g1_i1:72-794(+)